MWVNVQAGPCFREGLIVESEYQTTPENSFWKQSASRGRSSYGRHLDAAKTASPAGERYSYPRDACSLSLRCHLRSRNGNRVSAFPQPLAPATTVEISILKNSFRSNYKGVICARFKHYGRGP